MSDMGPPCVLCGHASAYHAANHCPYDFGAGRGHCDCWAYCPTVEVAQMRGFIPGVSIVSEGAPE
jgi:hypothetical protein